MVFWVFMLVMSLLIPSIMIIFGRLFLKKAPENINTFFGYRTAMSMKNDDTWKFAHKHFGKLWLRYGLIILPISVIPFLCVINKNTATVGNTGTFVMLSQIIPIFVSIFQTEAMLKKTFDQNGMRK